MAEVAKIVDHKGNEITRPPGPFSWLPFFMIVAMVLLIGSQVWRLLKPADAVATPTSSGHGFIYLTGGGGLDYNDSPPVTISDPVFVKALDVAMLRWQEALPSRKIKRPYLMQTKERSGGAIIAFVNIREYEVVVITDKMVKGNNFDWPSIMMHEVGHLLGVPHIQGDLLMDATYTEAVTKPTKFAVALAVANIKGE